MIVQVVAARDIKVGERNVQSSNPRRKHLTYKKKIKLLQNYILAIFKIRNPYALRELIVKKKFEKMII